MKALTTTLGLFFLTLLFFNNSMAQKANYTSRGGITIGLGAGYAYQTSDLANSKGLGLDFTLGTPLYHRENAFLGVDWKFRFLAGENRGYDHRINPDYTYSNIRYSFFNYDLELGITLNRLREHTGIVLTGFAGAGITHGRTFTDLYDAGNNLYDFEGIDPDRDSKLVYKDLVTLSDGDFETRLVNKAAFLPTAGLFIGYKFSRSITLGVEYKTNFYLTEKNSFAGIDLDNRVMNGSGIDRNNYVSVGLRWNLRGGASHRRATKNYSTGATGPFGNASVNDNLVVTAFSPQPSVNITDPSEDGHHTESAFQSIHAAVNNVNGPGDISFYQNGFLNNSFTYNDRSQLFLANVRLREGENNFRIKVSNQGLSAEDQITIILDHSIDIGSLAPSVEFSSPQGDLITTSSERIDVTAGVKNISSKEDIQLTLNGRSVPFEYYPVSGLVEARVTLTKEENNLLIKGSNGSGSVQDQLAISVRAVEDMVFPSVRFIQPAAPVEVTDHLFTLSAEIENVFGRNDITMRLNGNIINNFSFDSHGKVSVNLFLPEGINTMEITARNEAGVTSESTSIAYYQPVQYGSVQHPPAQYAPVQTPPVQYTPVYYEPVRNEPVAQESITREPVTREPVTREPVTREPVTRDPVNREGVTRERVIREGVTRETVTHDPVTYQPVAHERENRERVNREGVTHQPVSHDPVTYKPLTREGQNRNGQIRNGQSRNGQSRNGQNRDPLTTDPVANGPVNNNPVNNNPVNNNPVNNSPATPPAESAIRINPGNDAWQFCMNTPSGTFSRENLTDANFSYSGQASSLYFMPIGGGGTAKVNGRSITLKSGQYYLFTGNLHVSVSTNHPGSMGQWSVNITADRQPVTGNGNNRPKSPCETDNDHSSKGKNNRR